MSGDIVSWLERWYTDHCDGEWEHTYGVTIDTLDNPGWTIAIHWPQDEGAAFHPVDWEESELEWLHTERDGDILRVACGPRQLGRALEFVRATLESRGPQS
jgi:hypothetical protein